MEGVDVALAQTLAERESVAALIGQAANGPEVQGWIADEPMSGKAYEPVTCTACGRAHLINPKRERF